MRRKCTVLKGLLMVDPSLWLCVGLTLVTAVNSSRNHWWYCCLYSSLTIVVTGQGPSSPFHWLVSVTVHQVYKSIWAATSTPTPGWPILRQKRWDRSHPPTLEASSPTSPATSPTGCWTARGVPAHPSPSTWRTSSRKTTGNGWGPGHPLWQKNPPPSPHLLSTVYTSPTAAWALLTGCWVARGRTAIAARQTSPGPPAPRSHPCRLSLLCSRWRHLASRFLQSTWLPGSTRSACEASRHRPLLHTEVSAPCPSLTSDQMLFTDLQ